MATAKFQQQIFNDEIAARKALEAVRWPNGPTCPHCGSVEGIVALTTKSARPGLKYCNACKGQFTATVGTVFERSKIPLTKWWLASHLMGSSKKGFSAHQMHRTLGVTYKTAWFMAMRIREAMKDMGMEPMGGEGPHIEADETYIGNKHGVKKARSTHHKHAVFTVLERGGRARSFHIDKVTATELAKVMAKHANPASTLNTDEALRYRKMGKKFAKHQVVNHGKGQYGAGDHTTNSVEGFFSIFKRGMKGVYQHCSEDHLHRYLSEFDFRYSNRSALGIEDTERTQRLMKGIEGKRLTYRRTDKASEENSLG